MKRYFKHLGILELELVFGWKGMGLSNREISQKLNYDHTNISREIEMKVKYGKTHYACLS